MTPDTSVAAPDASLRAPGGPAPAGLGSAPTAPAPHAATPVGGDRGLRAAMRHFPTGVTVLTTGGPYLHGMTANAFLSVSLSPATVLCCVNHGARMHDAIAGAGFFAVSVLAGDQEAVARHFADRDRPAGAAEFDPVAWWPGPRTGAPLLAGALAWIECQLAAVHDGGSHAILLGRVLGTDCVAARDPLLFFRGTFGQVGS